MKWVGLLNSLLFVDTKGSGFGLTMSLAILVSAVIGATVFQSLGRKRNRDSS